MDNSLSEYWFALSKDTPGRTWFHARHDAKAVCRALRINPDDDGAIYATTPFRIARVNDKVVVLAAHPAPRNFTPIDEDWLDIATVIAWNPLDDTAHVLGDTAAQLVGAMSDDANQIHASPRTFFQAWAIRRAQFAVKARSLSGKSWITRPRERDEVPGALLIGDLSKVRINPAVLPEHIECVGVDPRELNKAIIHAARLPRAVASASYLRSVA